MDQEAKSARRIAVVGVGLVGGRHAELVDAHAVLDAVVDPSDAAPAVADRFGVPHFADLGDYLDRTAPDGVIVATPNQLHAQNARACVAKGLPVLVEKPVTDASDSAAELVAGAEAAGVPVLVGHHRRHNPLIAAAKQAIETGRVGDVRAVNAQFWLYKPDPYFDQTWRRQAGAGPIFINLIHDVDLLRHLCGEIVWVDARQSHAARGFAVEDGAAILMAFENGALGTVTASDAVVAPWSWELTAGENPDYHHTGMASYTIGGSHGSLSVPDLRLWSQSGERSWWRPLESETLDYAPANPLIRQLEHFIDVIEGRAAPLVSAREGAQTLAVIEAIKRAAETGMGQAVQPVSA